MAVERPIDAVIVGAGFSGLAAARRLRRNGLRVCVLEARDVVGGRVRRAWLAQHPVDVGGQWIGAGHDRLMALAQTAGVPLRPQYDSGAKLLQIGRRVRRYSGLIPPASPVALGETGLALWRLDRLKRGLCAQAPWRHRDAERLDGLTLDQWQRRWVRSRGGRALFDVACRAILCAEPSQVSMLTFLHYLRANRSLDYLIDTTDGAQALIVEGGMHSLARWLARDLGGVVQTGCPVRAIEQHADGVTVRTADRSLYARRAIMALAPMATTSIAMTPNASERIQLAQRMPMGSVIKCVIAYPTPFWREAGLSGELVSSQAPLSPVLDASPADSAMGILVGFISGRWAVRHSADPAARRAAVLDGLAEAFGPRARGPLDYVDYDWTVDPYSHGCYVGIPAPGTLSRLGPALRRPVDRIHWAGTETATQWTGYIEGALEAGERAASEVEQALRD